MSNKIGDENVANIEDDVELVKRYLKNSAYKESESNFFKNGGWEMVDLEIPKAMANILAELEQKDKRIQELEEVDIANRKVIVEQCDYIQNNSIPKQIVIDKMEELKKRKDKYEYETQEIFSNTYYDRKRLEIIHKIDILQELLEEEK